MLVLTIEQGFSSHDMLPVNDNIQKFTHEGQSLSKFGTEGSGLQYGTE